MPAFNEKYFVCMLLVHPMRLNNLLMIKHSSAGDSSSFNIFRFRVNNLSHSRICAVKIRKFKECRSSEGD